MAHPRKLIRHAVVALLMGADTTAGQRVKGTRVEPHKNTQLPALAVYTLTDPVSEDESTDSEQTNELEVEIAGWVAHTDAVPADDAMDDLAEQVEEAMKADPYLGGKASKMRLQGTVMQIREENGRGIPLVGIVVLTYVITYRVDLGVDATDLDDFRTVKSTNEVVGGIEDDTTPAEEVFTVQEPPP